MSNHFPQNLLLLLLILPGSAFAAFSSIPTQVSSSSIRSIAFVASPPKLTAITTTGTTILSPWRQSSSSLLTRRNMMEMTIVPEPISLDDHLMQQLTNDMPSLLSAGKVGTIDWNDPASAICGGVFLLYIIFSLGAGIKYILKDGWRPKV